MSGDLSGYLKIDCAVPPSTYAAAITSEYFPMANYEKVIFITECGSGLTASGSVTASLVAGYNTTGGNSAAIGVYTTMNGAPTDALTVTGAKALIVDNASSWKSITDTLVVNGITFTFNSSAGVTTGTFSTARYVATLNDGSVASACCQHLAAYINHGTYGCTGVRAVVNGNPITAASSNNVYLQTNGNTLLTVVAPNTDVQLVPTKFESILECNAMELSSVSSQKYVAVTITPSSASARLSAVCIRGGGRYRMSNTGTVSDYDAGANT